MAVSHPTVAGVAVLACIGLAAWSADALAQSPVPIEADALITDTDDWPRSKMLSLAKPGVTMIRARGWRCDSLSAIQPFAFSRGFSITCNRYNYRYEFRDRGGRWIVELK